jgi:deoxyadenosine/deoxycytidine kinase
MKKMIITIEGNIGCGKTTLLNKLKEKNEYNIVEEDVDEWKNEGWLQLFYSDMKRYSGTFQLRTQISHINNYKKFVKDKINIVERSPFSNKYIFGKMLMESNFLHEKEYHLIDKMNELVGWHPNMMIILNCEPELCYERYKKRGREGEEIPSIEYLKELHKKHIEMYDTMKEKHKNTKVILYKCEDKQPDVIKKEVNEILNKINLEMRG